MLALTILGNNSAVPAFGRNPTAQILQTQDDSFLIDCGEGTQMQIAKYKLRRSKLSHIFISHLHGDHFYGLIGLISTFMLLNRENDLHVYGPKGIKEIILLQLRASGSFTGYNLYFHELESKESEVVFEDDTVVVKTIPLNHRIYTNGFLFQEKLGKRHLNIEAVAKYKIEKVYFDKIKSGGNVTLDSGEVITNELLSFPPDAPMSYAFCSDTLYDESIVPIIKDVDVLYHESTFLDSEMQYTEKTKHATAKEAAQIAKLANVKNLILGHYSTRYGSIEPFKTEAQTIFENVLLADDGKEFEF